MCVHNYYFIGEVFYLLNNEEETIVLINFSKDCWKIRPSQNRKKETRKGEEEEIYIFMSPPMIFLCILTTFYLVPCHTRKSIQ